MLGRPRRLSLAGAALSFAALAACGAAGNARPASPLEVRYRMMVAGEREPRVATAIYRDVLSRTLFSECQMVPRDSEAFNQRLRWCGPVGAVMVSMSRLMLEMAAQPAYLTPVRLDGRLLWLDPPTSCIPR
jgi:hypothetical protein